MERVLFAMALLLPLTSHAQAIPQNAVSVSAQPREAARHCRATRAAILDRLGERMTARTEAGSPNRDLGYLSDGGMRAIVHLSTSGHGSACRYTVRLVPANGSTPSPTSSAGLFERFAAPACDLVARREVMPSVTAQHIALNIDDMLARCFALVVR